jgi:hypothetical protein
VGIAENGAVQNELTLRQIVDGISALVAVLTPDGAVEIVRVMTRNISVRERNGFSRCTSTS